jgi:hypothetical protein
MGKVQQHPAFELRRVKDLLIKFIGLAERQVLAESQAEQIRVRLSGSFDRLITFAKE